MERAWTALVTAIKAGKAQRAMILMTATPSRVRTGAPASTPETSSVTSVRRMHNSRKHGKAATDVLARPGSQATAVNASTAARMGDALSVAYATARRASRVRAAAKTWTSALAIRAVSSGHAQMVTMLTTARVTQGTKASGVSARNNCGPRACKMSAPPLLVRHQQPINPPHMQLMSG